MPSTPKRSTAFFCKESRFAPMRRRPSWSSWSRMPSRDVNIAFANELSLICDQLGLNVWQVIELANRHPRVSILQPGPGVGGHCIAVDPWFIISSAPERTRLIRTAREVNDAKPKFVVSQIRERAERFKRPVVACLGSDLQAGCRRSAGEPGDRDRRATGARRSKSRSWSPIRI